LVRVGEALIRNPRGARLGLALLVILGSLGWGAAAYGRLSGRNYHGHTSQRQKISFRIVENLSLRRLAYRIVDTCPKGRKLIDRGHGYPPMPIFRGRFGGTFLEHFRDGKAVIAGTVSNRSVTGSISDQTRNTRTHKLCTGQAHFTVRLH
jgi:hypothetical protein